MSIPTLTLYNHQRTQQVNRKWIEKTARAAMPACIAAAKSLEAPLLTLEEIEVSIVSDKRMTQVHADFLDDATPTDVITFHHGEILVSADTAKRQGAEHGQTMDRELALYIVHGLLHLAGWNDECPEEQREMHRLQDSILNSVDPIA